MKTKFKIALLAFSLFMSVTGAFASEISTLLGEQKATLYNWQKYLPDGTPVGDPVLGDDQSPFAECCQGSSEVCAVGAPVLLGSPIIVLRYQ